MSSELAIKAVNLSKCYHIFEQPRDRLKQFIYPRIQGAIGQPTKQYYKEFWALENINFEVAKGEAVGIIGRNGSGKSTLLQIITGTLTPTSGSVETKGRIAALLELGSGFNPEFTGRENVYLNGSLLGLTTAQIDEKFDAIAGFADIGAHLDQPIKTYSSGMIVRLAFAVQVQVEPDILVVDEALAVGDWLFQKRCFQRIEKLVSDGTTLLFVSHDQESVRTLTNRALLLNHGKSQAWGTSSDVVLEYRRLLHEEEMAYFSSLIPEPAKVVHETASVDENEIEPNTDISAVDSRVSNARSSQLEFGEGHVRITGVRVLDCNDQDCAIFSPGDTLKIRVHCKTSEPASNLNVAIRIRNKEGVKIYSWGTLNQDMSMQFSGNSDKSFWRKNISKNEEFYVQFECDCPLGMNLYEVQAAVSHEETPDYSNQRILHWIDEAAFFQVLLRKDEYFFGGICDLRVHAQWSN
ncbi:ABC transporter ATP-binding protein [Chitiniphilus eburneus]|uniref:ABC transporter ATP-binding protein n=1 Tax=Chitiniphilus eburneus TaxID=2571148 RepID=A0A4V5MRQ5_9NEIS|nr:ABC transporter ATP-binding protein [Chitiniphilus eburneus]TJZ77278.1 ABC transporter ATP-binding protein [Chitiniphilus eburneus]